jgi:hypothetical protein
MLHHVVLLEMRPSAEPGDVESTLDAIRAQRVHVEGLLDVTAGPDVSVEALAGGFTHGVLMRFADERARDAYLSPPSHDALRDRLADVVDRALVVDVAG